MSTPSQPPRRPCIADYCDRQTRSDSQICRFCQVETTGPPINTKCLSCGTRTTRDDRLCAGCAYHYANAHAYEPSPEDDLTGGQWVLVGRVWRWQTEEAA